MFFLGIEEEVAALKQSIVFCNSERVEQTTEKEETTIAKEVEFFQAELMKMYQANKYQFYYGGYE